MRRSLPVVLGVIVLAGGLAACSPASDSTPDTGSVESAPTVEATTPEPVQTTTEPVEETAALDPCPFTVDQVNAAFASYGFASTEPEVSSSTCDYANNGGGQLMRVTVEVRDYGSTLGYTQNPPSPADFSFAPPSRAEGWGQACVITQAFVAVTADPTGNSALAHCDQGSVVDTVNFPQNARVYAFADSGIYEIAGSGLYVSSTTLNVADFPELVTATDSLRALALQLNG